MGLTINRAWPRHILKADNQIGTTPSGGREAGWTRIRPVLTMWTASSTPMLACSWSTRPRGSHVPCADWLERIESVGRFLPAELGAEKVFDRTSLIMTTWLPQSRLAGGDPAAFPVSPPMPLPQVAPQARLRKPPGPCARLPSIIKSSRMAMSNIKIANRHASPCSIPSIS
jgi:hypothetical protein